MKGLTLPDKLRLNIALIPDQKSGDEAIKLSKTISKKFQTLFVLDGKNVLPHISVYSPEFPGHNVNNVISYVKKILEPYSSFQLKFSSVYQRHGFILINFKSNKSIKSLHETMVMALNHLRENVLLERYKDPEYLNKLTQLEQENIRKYGHPFVLNNYHAHISITRFPEEIKVEKFIETIRWTSGTIKINKVGIFKMGDNGTCIELIKEFGLKEN